MLKWRDLHVLTIVEAAAVAPGPIKQNIHDYFVLYTILIYYVLYTILIYYVLYTILIYYVLYTILIYYVLYTTFVNNFSNFTCKLTIL